MVGAGVAILGLIIVNVGLFVWFNYRINEVLKNVNAVLEDWIRMDPHDVRTAIEDFRHLQLQGIVTEQSVKRQAN